MSRDERLFVAIDPPAAAREEIAGWARSSVSTLGGLRRIPAASLHVTLCFLGAQPTELLDEIARVVAAHDVPVEPVRLGAPVWLPPRRPRALAIELTEAAGSLAALAADLREGLRAAIGWQPDSRRFRPHITVARMPAGAVRPAVLEPTPPLVFEPSALTLYRSLLEADGAVYEVVARVKARPDLGWRQERGTK